ncbi:hypothetical protein GGH97_005299 [Coemansia sp. RSA 475]|nr:hypothetical protein GGH97_005299 [Coemansia sp. RSA 475]
MTNYNSVSAFLPLAMLILVLFLPGILILITTRKWVYVLWMFVYLLALPIWNFVLPVYAYWHFDDFSWGETRKVHGETKDAGHGDSGGTFDASTVPLKRWEDYERKRLRSIRRKERKDDDSSSYQMPIVDDSANAGLLKNSVEESAYYESHPGYSFMADTSAGGSSGTLGNMHPPQQFELQSYPSMGGDSVYAAEGDPYGAGHGYPTQQQQYGAYDDYSQQQGAYGYEGHEQQQPSRQRPGGPRDYQ